VCSIGPYHESVYNNCKGQRGFGTAQSNSVSKYSNMNIVFGLVMSSGISAFFNKY
jgi:hypothetical protein